MDADTSSGAFPPPSLMGTVTPIPTPILLPSPLPSAVPAPTQPALQLTPVPAFVDSGQLAPPPVVAGAPSGEQPAEARRQPSARRTPPRAVEGTRQDIIRLLAFGFIGVAGAVVLGVISLFLWRRD